MPEGDTILRSARVLERAIGGQVIKRFESNMPGVAGAKLAGKKIEKVEAQGKNLLVHFEGGRVLRTHMKMTGSWHIYRPGERWRKSPGAARVVIEAGEWVAVCFAAPVVELFGEKQLETHRPLSELGPDVLADDFDPEEATRRIAAEADRELGDVLLDQKVLAGIGNVYKSELLFLAKLHPRTRVGGVSTEALRAIVDDAAELMRANLTTSSRRTRALALPSGSRFWVYRRSGEPCLRCGTIVAMLRQGELARSTYYCPSCQSSTGASGAAG